MTNHQLKKCENCTYSMSRASRFRWCCETCRIELKKKDFARPLTELEREMLFKIKRDGWTTATLVKHFGVTQPYLQELVKRADAQFTGDQILEFYGVKSETLHNP